MNKLEALEKIAELQKFVEELDKPKQVRAYIKLSAKDHCAHGWNDKMTGMLGGVYDVCKKSINDGARIYVDDKHSDWFTFNREIFVIVEGSLDDLKE